MVIAAVEIFLINRELYLGRSQGPTTWNAIMRRVFHKRSDIKFEPQSTIFVVICWKAVKVAVCMFEETSAYFNGTVKQLSLLVHRVLVFIIRVKCREHLTQVTRLSLERDRIFISKFTYFRRYIDSFDPVRKNSLRRDSNTNDFR